MDKILASGSGGVKLCLRAPSIGIDLERYLSAGVPIFQLKGTLEQITGIPPSGQTLQLAVPNQAPIDLVDENKSLFDYGAQTGNILLVQGTAPAWLQAVRGQVENEESLPHWEMPDEQYAARSNTVRAQLAAVRAQQAASQPSEPTAPTAPTPPLSEIKIKVGDRCEVERTTGPARGTVRFVGEAEMPATKSGHKPGGIWVGVQYDEPVGANDGSVEGKRYFDALPKYGGFVRPEKVQVGDYPEQDLFDEDEDEEM